MRKYQLPSPREQTAEKGRTDDALLVGTLCGFVKRMKKAPPKRKQRKASRLTKMLPGTTMAADIRARAKKIIDPARRAHMERAAQIVETHAKVPRTTALIDFRPLTAAERRHARTLEPLAKECRARNGR